MPDELLDVTQLMGKLNCGRSTVYALLGSGKLPVVRLGRAMRVSVGAYDAFIAAGGVADLTPTESPTGNGSHGASKPRKPKRQERSKSEG